MFWWSSRGRPENILETSRIILLWTSLERQFRIPLGSQIRTPPGRHFETSPGHQIRTSPGWSNSIFWGRPLDVRVGRPPGFLEANIFCLESLMFSPKIVQHCLTNQTLNQVTRELTIFYQLLIKSTNHLIHVKTIDLICVFRHIQSFGKGTAQGFYFQI